MTLLVIGLLLGLLSATVTESLGHRLFGHPGKLQVKLYFKYPRLFAAFLKPYYQHLVIHHHKTFRHDFFHQFEDEHEKREVDAWIEKKFSKEFAGLIWRERYNLTLVGVDGTLPFAIPFMTGPALIGLALGPVAFAGSLITAFIPVWLSKFLHPLVHLPHETANFHPLIRRLMRTEYMRRVFRNHYLHHQHLETNFNLLLGGDYLVFHHRPATQKEEEDLARLLPEFDRRVRMTREEAAQYTPVGTRRDMISEPASEIARDLQQSGDQAYLSLENPDYEQRFQYQRWKSTVQDPSRAEGRIDFGMGLYDKRISLEQWSKKKEFILDGYHRDGDAVVYRGARFETGDVLLTNQASDSDGLFSTLLEGSVSFAHVALFAILDCEGRRAPAVVEINEYGVRAVPLKAFLSQRFNTYVEVFRMKEPLSESVRSAIAKASLELMGESHAFDIYQDDSQSVYLNCARTVAEIHRRAGIAPVAGSSRYSEKTLRNLETLGIQGAAGKDLLMPDDYTRDPRFRIVGTVDNGCFEQVLSRALVRERIQEIWQTELLDPSCFPLDYPMSRFVVEGIQQDKWYAPLLHRFVGLAPGNFPWGPVVFLSLVPAGNRRMESASREVRRGLAACREKIARFGSWAELKEDDEIRSLVVAASLGFRKMFRKRSVVLAANPVAERLPRAPRRRPHLLSSGVKERKGAESSHAV